MSELAGSLLRPMDITGRGKLTSGKRQALSALTSSNNKTLAVLTSGSDAAFCCTKYIDSYALLQDVPLLEHSIKGLNEYRQNY